MVWTRPKKPGKTCRASLAGPAASLCFWMIRAAGKSQTLIAQGPLNRAKVLCGDRVADSLPQAAIDPALVDKLDGLEALGAPG